MFVLAPISIVGTVPIPAILLLFHRFKEEFTNDVRLTSLDHLFFFLANLLPQLVLGQFVELFPSDSVHNKLNPLVDIQIDLFSPIKGQVMRIDTLFSFLA